MISDTLAPVVDLVAARAQRDVSVIETEPCHFCTEPVSVPRLGAEATITADGYDGFDADGWICCRTCWCAVCGLSHTDPGEREMCETGDHSGPACDADPEPYTTAQLRTYALGGWSTPLWATEEPDLGTDPHDPENGTCNPDRVRDAVLDR